MQEPRIFTNADFARNLGRFVRNAVSALAELAYGMWNPDFCKAEGSTRAADFIIQMREFTNQLERMMEPPHD